MTKRNQRKSLQEGTALRLRVLFPFFPYFTDKGLSGSPWPWVSPSARKNAAFSQTETSLISNFSQQEKLPRRKLHTSNCKEKMAWLNLFHILLFLRLKTVKRKPSALKILSAFFLQTALLILCVEAEMYNLRVGWFYIKYVFFVSLVKIWLCLRSTE